MREVAARMYRSCGTVMSGFAEYISAPTPEIVGVAAEVPFILAV